VTKVVEERNQADEEVIAFHARFAPFFFRAQVRERTRRCLPTCLGSIERKNGRQVAESMADDDL